MSDDQDIVTEELPEIIRARAITEQGGAIRYWREKGYIARDVAAAFESVQDTDQAVVLELMGDKCLMHPTRKLLAEGPHLINAAQRYIDKVMLTHFEALSGPILFCLEDRIDEERFAGVPVIGLGRKERSLHLALVPDLDFVAGDRYAGEREEVLTLIESIPWNKKVPTAFWRGSSTGGKLDSEEWQNNQRIALVLKAKAIADTKFLDAALSDIVQCRKESSVARIKAAGLLGNRVSFPYFFAYKYLIDVDGNACAWRSFYLKLLSNCAVIKILQEQMEWYYPRLSPWEHFIPVAPDLSDLEERIIWAKDHDEECERIAYRGREFALELAKENPYIYAGAVIGQLLKAYKG